ncbi:ATPase inhibitor subunit zeta [Rhizobium jaguaris]|uniref:ATPase inhibitor subunit zeta n=1 Tax=Rhizobium jaguaris TaxID=1312183 RepID=UPI0039BF8C0C
MEEVSMSILEKREEAAEKEYVINLERTFRVRARRDKLLSRWAADLIGRQDVDAYFGEVITASLAEAGDEGEFRKIWGDLQSVGASIDEAGLRETMRKFSRDATEQVRLADAG